MATLPLPLPLPLPLLLLLLTAASSQARRSPVHVQSTRGDTGDVTPWQTGGVSREALYAGHQVLRVFVTNSSTIDLLRRYEDTPGVDFWTPASPLAHSVDIMVSPEARTSLTRQLVSNGIRYRVNINDVRDAISKENPTPSSSDLELLEGRLGHRLTWTAYHRVAEHHQYLDHIGQSYRGLCDTFSIGTSSEGRDLKTVKCGLGKREIWIDGGIHAREWISPAVVSYLVKDFSENSFNFIDILKEFTIYFIPVLNPDGYEHTHNGDRMWRKTRSKNLNSRCIGTDPNRNFDIHWQETGTSTNPCSNVYGGPRPFSEPETRAVRDFLLSHAANMEMYISFHSYSQYLFVPYAYTTAQPDDYAQLEKVARKGVRALSAAGGPLFSVGQASNLLYTAAGGSDDWAKQVADIKYSYTFELRDKGAHGFLLPQNLIKQSGSETSAAVAAMIRAIL